MRKKRGFTLVELLAVIVILAFMVAILLPALRNAQQKGYAMACASNMRQIGVAIANYCTDNNGFYPHIARCTRGVPTPSTYGWWSVLAEKGYLSKEDRYPASEGDAYVYPSKVFHCRAQSERDTHPTWGAPLGFQIASAYGLNIFFDSYILGTAEQRDDTAYWAAYPDGYGAGGVSEGDYTSVEGDIKAKGATLRDGSKVYLPVRESTVQMASEKFLVADVLYRRPDTYYRNTPGSLWHSCFLQFTPFYGHPGNRANILFADYHVGTIRSNDEGILLTNSIKDGISSGRVDESQDSTSRPSIPGAISTNARFYHWSPFAIRNDWDNWLPRF